ncbi:hypothetical protein COCCADRAFT_99191 [Bipolaris zeicola 26-R-13]|uniref:Uncharacterized protein n=1 Tax=Cochliobolus carbonum (strain 26-R-13) TaxID=930089 RepID=W6Y9Z9_COCC2|nr:uncharacterized protein COCCADRAFT_99191 [Bipolaris zeicola 26-R-13]EUC32259.1 hypothetical protein COCCADRAFT_99191 [Bipolaris zeicola 26-R-13]
MDHHTFTSFFSHLLAPVSHTQCTSSAPCSSPTYHEEHKEKEPHIIRLAEEEEELARLQHGEQQDGTPLCREGGIAAWHQQQPQQQQQQGERRDSMEVQKKRRASLEWLAGVIRERRVHV